MNEMIYLFIYLVCVNVITLIMFYMDKKSAVKNGYRMPERTLISLAAVGGSIGEIIGMYAFRHKTNKKKFKIGLPVILMLQIALAVIICLNN
jgi:uncharacterized membrane protein YsdA (DUF1294 family)